jgi:signal transduction histidine kinase
VFSGLRFRLLLLLLLACAPLAALTLDTAIKERRQAKINWRNSARTYFSAVTNEVDSLHRDARQLLLAISEDNGVRSMDPESAKVCLNETVASRDPSRSVRYSNLGLASTNGEVVASVHAVKQPMVNQLRRSASSRRFSRYLPARTNANPVILFCSPVIAPDKSSTAVVFAEYNLATLNAFHPKQLREGATWMGIDTNGTIVFRHPEDRPAAGFNVQNPWLVSNVFAQASGMLEGAGSGGAPVCYFFNTWRSRLGTGNIAYVLSVPKHVMFAKADTVLWQHLTALGVAVGIALALGWVGSKFLILRPVEALARSSARLAAGDLSVRTGLPPSRDELGQLTAAFDKMAESLQQREQERQRASHKLQLLSHKLVEVQETERRHIARELHDEIGQSLTAAEMNLQAALQMHGSAALERRLEESIQAVERVLEQVHDLSLNLRPSMLDDLGLEPALRWYTQRQAALTGLKAEFRADIPSERLDPLVETECFRVAQEALTNVVRHAHARGVTVHLSKRNGHLHLMVRDDGVGFDVNGQREKAVRGASLGLLSMDERASLAGGGLELRSIAGQGTEVHAWFPLRPKSTSSLSQLNE